MVEEVRHEYEVSSESAVVHWAIPYARMTDTTPTATQPAEVTCRTAGLELTGTILTTHAGTTTAIVDFTNSMVYLHEVRNVLTYAAGNEDTWGAMNIGDTVYYDGSNTMPAGVKLSTSPLDRLGAANPKFGRVVPAFSGDTAAKGAGGVASTQEVAVMQIGAGGS